MAIGKKRNGGVNPLAGIIERQKDRRAAALARAQKAAQENMAGNRQLETARAQAATPGHATASLTSAPTPDNWAGKLRLGHQNDMERLRAQQEFQGAEAEKERGWKSGETEKDRQYRAGEAEKDRQYRAGESEKDRQYRAGEAEKDRQYRAGESEKDRQYRAGEAEKERGWRSVESRSERDWKSAESRSERDWRSSEAALGREESQRDRDWRSSEAELGRKHQSAESKLSREQQIKLQQMQNAGALERLREQGAQQTNAQRKARKYALQDRALDDDRWQYRHDVANMDAAAANDEWRRRQEFADRLIDENTAAANESKMKALRMQYGIPDGVELSNENWAKILAGTHEYVGNSQDEKNQIAAYEKVLDGQLSQEDRDAVQLEYDLYREDHPANRVQEIPLERRAPKPIDIKGQTYIYNKGGWEPLQDKQRPKTAEQIAGGIYTLPDGTQVYSDGNTLKQVPSSIPKDPTYADYQKYLRDFEKNKDSFFNEDAQPMSAQDFVKQWRDFNGALRPNDVQGNNPNGYSNEDWAWITEQFNAGNLTDMELSSLGLTVENGTLVPIDYEAQAAAAQRTSGSRSSGLPGNVDVNIHPTTPGERTKKWDNLRVKK